MRGVARLGDKTWGVCYHQDHEYPIEIAGTIIGASTDVLCGGSAFGIARIGDKVLSDCDHIGYIITGDETVFIDNMNVARLGDLVDGDDPEGNYTATIVTCATDIIT